MSTYCIQLIVPPRSRPDCRWKALRYPAGPSFFMGKRAGRREDIMRRVLRQDFLSMRRILARIWPPALARESHLPLKSRPVPRRLHWDS